MERPILVTGATGFIGRHLVAALRSTRERVRVTIRRPDLAGAMSALGAEPIVGDLLDPAFVARAAHDVRAVFHLAGRLYAPGEPELEYERLHVDATMTLLRQWTEPSALDYFVLCSTTGVHGDTGQRLAREDDLGHPTNAYERTKARAEHLGTELAGRVGMRLAIARPGLVYGPGDRHLLGWFRAIQAGYYRVIGSGTNRFHPIYVDDLVRGLMLTASAASNTAPVYHLVGSRPTTMRELSDAIGTAVGRRVPQVHLPRAAAFVAGAALEALPLPRRVLPLTRSRVRFMTGNRAYDGSRAREELSFSPEVELEEGLARTVAWYREHRWL
jgi:nucleoside-diphosphate-sugar epimerase